MTKEKVEKVVNRAIAVGMVGVVGSIGTWLKEMVSRVLMLVDCVVVGMKPM